MLISSRTNTFLLVLILAVGIGLVAMLASGVRGGPLDPSGAPAPSMHTLDNSPVVWDRVIAANDGPDVCHSSRFSCVMPTLANPTGEAVLDRETSLVWQRVPPSGLEDWLTAVQDCMNNQLGGRFGWRMPRIEELRSLLDTTGDLPIGNPFSNISTFSAGLPHTGYWSAMTAPDQSTSAYVAGFPLGFAVWAKSFQAHVWCVRGGAGLGGV